MARAFDTLMEEELRRRSVPGASPFDIPPPEPRRNINSIVDPSADTFIDRFRPVSSDPAGDYQKEQRFEMQRRMQEIEKGVPVYRPGTPRFGDPTKVISQAGTGTATDALPPGFSYADAPSGLPPGFSYADAPEATRRAPTPEVPINQDVLAGPEGTISPAPETTGPGRGILGGSLAVGLGREVNRLGEVAKRAVQTGDIEPKEALEAAMMLNPASAAYRTGMGVARTALTPAEVAARETGVLSIPRAADASPLRQAVGRGLSAAPVGGGALRGAAERATGELQAVGTAAAARPTGEAVARAEAGGATREALRTTLEEMQSTIGAKAKFPPRVRALLRGTDEDIVGRIATMASQDKRGADIKTLGLLRSGHTAEEWAPMQSALIGQFGRSPASGEFDPRTWLRNYSGLSDAGKNVLFGRGGDALRGHLDAIEAVSRRAPSWQQFQRERASLGTRVGVAALAGAGTFMAPLTVLGSVIPMAVLSRSLARPATAAPIAQWSRAYERVARTQGAPQAIASLTIATRNLNNTLGTDVSVDDILKGGQ